MWHEGVVWALLNCGSPLGKSACRLAWVAFRKVRLDLGRQSRSMEKAAPERPGHRTADLKVSSRMQKKTESDVEAPILLFAALVVVFASPLRSDRGLDAGL